MKDNNMYEMTLDSTQLNILERALSAFISEAYSGIEDEVVDVENTYEEVKVAHDIKQVIRYEKDANGSPKQTSKDTSLVWIKKAFTPVEFSDLTKEQIDWSIEDEGVKPKHIKVTKEMWEDASQRVIARHIETLKSLANKQEKLI